MSETSVAFGPPRWRNSSGLMSDLPSWPTIPSVWVDVIGIGNCTTSSRPQLLSWFPSNKKSMGHGAASMDAQYRRHLVIPNMQHADIAVAAKGLDSTDSKLTTLCGNRRDDGRPSTS